MLIHFKSLRRISNFLIKEIIILGDTNCNISVLESAPDSTKKSNINATVHLREIYDLLGLAQLIQEPSGVTLDTDALIAYSYKRSRKHF